MKEYPRWIQIYNPEIKRYPRFHKVVVTLHDIIFDADLLTKLINRILQTQIDIPEDRPRISLTITGGVNISTYDKETDAPKTLSSRPCIKSDAS